jgi:hypothetical protein
VTAEPTVATSKQRQGVDDAKDTDAPPGKQKRQADPSRGFYCKPQTHEDVRVLEDDAEAGGTGRLEYRAEDTPVVLEPHPSDGKCPRHYIGEAEDNGDYQGHAGDSDEQDEAGCGGQAEELLVEPGAKSRRHLGSCQELAMARVFRPNGTPKHIHHPFRRTSSALSLPSDDADFLEASD